jgi:hypothetical protein
VRCPPKPKIVEKSVKNRPICGKISRQFESGLGCPLQGIGTGTVWRSYDLVRRRRVVRNLSSWSRRLWTGSRFSTGPMKSAATMRAFAPFISEIRPSGGGLPTVAFHERRLRDVFSPGAPHLFGPIETPSWVSWLRQALLDLNRDDLAWRIQANPASAVDLTAKWKFDDSHWSDELRKSGMMPGLRVHLRLHEDVHLVRPWTRISR